MFKKMIFITRTFIGIIKLGENTQTNVFRPNFKSKLPVLNGINSVTSNTRLFSTGENEHNINYGEIANGDEKLEHKLKVLALETEVMRQDGKPVPEISFLKTDHWKELISLSSRSARQRYLEYLFKLEKRNENRKVKSEERKKGYEEYLSRREIEKANKQEETLEEFASTYGLQHNNIFLRFYDTTINQLYNNRLIQAMKFGQKMVIDLGYDNNMTKRENLNCAKQLMLLFAENRAHDDPFDIHFCNANKESELIKQFKKHIPTMDEPWFPLNLHECSYLDMFPKNQLVYLTPHTRQEVTEFDHDAVYIVGGIVDKVNQEPLSLAKAKREGLKMAKLPLDRHVQWGSGSGKSLTLNQVIAIMLDQKLTGNWEHSFRHIPRRKLFTEENTLKAIDQAYNRKRMHVEKTRWSPSFNKSGLKKMNSKEIEDGKEKMSNIKNIFND